ncbi:MAG: L,D-transpeptidase [Methylophilaceae bacterium]|jgi:L,D-transpeptidase YbiS|nr:L,D-transpeptidase [Methylophilaceae bacterium]NDF80696.1 L,D-transpeptidase [Methylophilaceae bacterium]
MHLKISVKEQKLHVYCDDNERVKSFVISTALKGVGQNKGSFCTPLGQHIVRAKIGDGAPIFSEFVARRLTGKIWSPTISVSDSKEDWILTRILWLSGLEVGFNRLGNQDTMQRFIYIHGTNDLDNLGKPSSHGCIRMDNYDIIDLFDQIKVGDHVLISEI